MSWNFNKGFLKWILIIGLIPVVPGLIVSIGSASPLLLLIILLFLAYKFIPGFRPFSMTFSAIGTVLRGIGYAIALPFAFLAGRIPIGQRGARFMPFYERFGLIGVGEKGFLVDGHRLRLSEKASFESIITVGGMGRGKSSTFVIPNLLTLDGPSFVVADTSGEIYDRTSGDLARRGYQIKVLNLMDMTASDQYNPLARLKTFTELSQAAGILIRAAYPNPSPEQQFWNAGAEKLIRVFVNCLHNLGHPDHINLPNIRHLIANFDNHLTPAGQLSKIDRFVLGATQNDPATFTDYQALANGNAKTISSMVTTADVALSPLGDPDLSRLLAGNSIDFGELRRRKTVLYILVKQQQMSHYLFLLNLFYTDLFDSLLNSTTNIDRPVYLLLDEFGHLQIPNFQVFATTARKYRVGFWIFLQSLAQLESRYGRDDAKTILEGLQTEIYLPGIGYDTAQWLERRMGQAQNGKQQKPLMTADEIIRMKDKHALMLHSNKRPVKLKTKPYFKQGGMARKSKRPPAALPTIPPGQSPLVPL